MTQQLYEIEEIDRLYAVKADLEKACRVMAAAPELLEALKTFMAMENTKLKGALDWDVHKQVFDKGEAAIAKATGK